MILKDKRRLQGIKLVAILMILFGLAEVVTGYKHHFFSLITSRSDISTFSGITLGIFYLIGGVLLLTHRKWTAKMAIVLLAADVIGRIGMVVTGLYPLNSLLQISGIVIGSAIAVFFTIYVALNLKYLS